MQHWTALRLEWHAGASPTEPAQALASWALQFTPRVALLEEAVVLEVAASLRLFGGEEALHARIAREAVELGIRSWSWAPTSLGALALARAGVVDGFAQPLARLLDALPMGTLSALVRHQATLARLGCRTLGDVRRLPRGGLNRRFDPELLAALDQAYGLRPSVHAWVVLPETFACRLELPSRVEQAPALGFGARRLLLQMSGWLAARHCGVTAFTLRWHHDPMRSRESGSGGELVVRTAEPSCSVEHLGRLLSEHLAHVELAAPVDALELQALETRALPAASASLLPGADAEVEPLHQVIERLSARLGAERVLRPVLREDHRLEWMQQWQPAEQALPRRKVRISSMPQPSWVLREPLPLAVRDHRPLYQGELQLLSGPHRIEAGWWHRPTGHAGAGTAQVQRDYWLAFSEHAGVLWIFQQRLGQQDTGWFLHGVFG